MGFYPQGAQIKRLSPLGLNPATFFLDFLTPQNCPPLGPKGRFGDPWGASLAKNDFGSKTSKLAEAFDENCRGGPQNSNASTVFF